jgi:4-alpha-glucanotransferase
VEKRASGILLHISSLPSNYGIGDLGPQAYKFADFLTAGKQSYWQVLPLNPPTLRKNPYSPYNCSSAFAGNTFLISPQLLYQEGFLVKKDIQQIPEFPGDKVNYKTVIPYKTKLLKKAFVAFRNKPKPDEFVRFCTENKNWLEDFSIFAALRKSLGFCLWCDWPYKLKERTNKTIKSIKVKLYDEIEREQFLQYMFFKQWYSLKSYCNQHGIKLIGDISFYVAYDSADVWANPEIFKLYRNKRPKYAAGVPPDYFSRNGQLWGNPVYNWHTLKSRRYFWWKKRVEQSLKMFDLVRIDHFRGFSAFWQVPAHATTATKGRWVTGPGKDFFDKSFKKSSMLKKVIAEDLGHITPDVHRLIKVLRIPGMRVLLFAFDGNRQANPHHPNNHIRNSVVYTGTHDTNTIRGWFEREAKARQKKCLYEYTDKKITASSVHRELIRLAMNSVADLVIIPMQDILGLGVESRMNHPGTVRNNWTWRMKASQITSRKAQKLAKMTEITDRS